MTFYRSESAILELCAKAETLSKGTLDTHLKRRLRIASALGRRKTVSSEKRYRRLVSALSGVSETERLE